jgi:hypothetical protein
VDIACGSVRSPMMFTSFDPNWNFPIISAGGARNEVPA